MQQPLDVAIDAKGVARVTLNRVGRANAFDPALVSALHDALATLAMDSALRVLVLAAAGRSFSAGLDLKVMQDRIGASPEEIREEALLLARLLHRLNTIPIPTLALVSGPAIGLGAGLVACCDVAIASDQASFRFSEVRLGIIPAVISPYVIAAIGERACRRYFLSAEGFDAAEARRLGLVHEVVRPEELEEAAARLISEILAGIRGAQRAAKRLIEDVRLAPRDETLSGETARRLAELRSSPETKAALAQFLAH